MFWLINPYNRAGTWVILAESGTYAITGNAVQYLRDLKLVVSVGTYNVAGQDIDLYKSIIMPAAKGGYDLVGMAAILQKTFKLDAAPGTYTLSGQVAQLLRALRLNADTGSFALTGLAASLRRTRIVPMDSGGYALTGVAAGLTKGVRMVADPGAYSLTGISLDAFRLVIEAGLYSLSGKNMLPVVTRKVVADVGNYALSGKDVLFLRKGIASPGAYALTGIAAALSGPALALTPIDTFWTTDNNSTIALGSFSIPSAGLIIIAYSSRSVTGSVSRSGFDIGGSPAFEVVSLGGVRAVGIVQQEVGSGGSYSASITFTSTMTALLASVYLLTGMASTTNVDEDSLSSTTVESSVDMTCDIPSGGGVMIAAHEHNNTTATTVTGSGVTTRREENDGSYSFNVSDYQSASAETKVINFSHPSTGTSSCAASWG